MFAEQDTKSSGFKPCIIYLNKIFYKKTQFLTNIIYFKYSQRELAYSLPVKIAYNNNMVVNYTFAKTNVYYRKL